MSLLKKFKETLIPCKHQWITRFDERNDLDDDKTHIFKITSCDLCGKVKEIEEVK